MNVFICWLMISSYEADSHCPPYEYSDENFPKNPNVEVPNYRSNEIKENSTENLHNHSAFFMPSEIALSDHGSPDKDIPLSLIWTELVWCDIENAMRFTLHPSTNHSDPAPLFINMKICCEFASPVLHTVLKLAFVIVKSFVE